MRLGRPREFGKIVHLWFICRSLSICRWQYPGVHVEHAMDINLLTFQYVLCYDQNRLARMCNLLCSNGARPS